MPFDAPQTFMQGLGFGAQMARHADQNALARAEEARQAALLPMRIQQMQWQLKNAALDYSLQQEQMADMTAAKEGTIQLSQVMKGITDWSDPAQTSKAFDVLARNPAAMKTPLFQELNFRVRAAEHAKQLREIATIQADARRQASQTLAQSRRDASEISMAARMQDKPQKNYGPPQSTQIKGATVIYREGAPGMHVITGGKLSDEEKSKLVEINLELRGALGQYNKAKEGGDYQELQQARIRIEAARKARTEFFKTRQDVKSTYIDEGGETMPEAELQDGGDTTDQDEEDLLLGDGVPAAIPGQTPLSSPPTAPPVKQKRYRYVDGALQEIQ